VIIYVVDVEKVSRVALWPDLKNFIFLFYSRVTCGLKTLFFSTSVLIHIADGTLILEKKKKEKKDMVPPSIFINF